MTTFEIILLVVLTLIAMSVINVANALVDRFKNQAAAKLEAERRATLQVMAEHGDTLTSIYTAVSMYNETLVTLIKTAVEHGMKDQLDLRSLPSVEDLRRQYNLPPPDDSSHPEFDSESPA